MATDEEYLDNLLKSLSDGEPGGSFEDDFEKENEDFLLRAQNFEENGLGDWKDNVDDILTQTLGQDSEEEETLQEYIDREGSNVFVDDSPEEESPVSEEPELNGMETVNEEETEENSTEETTGESSFSGEGMLDDPNLLQMIENMHESDSELEEINSLLNKANLNEGIDDDMLALLESAEESQDYHNSGEAFDIFAENEMEELPGMNMNARAGTGQEGEQGSGKKKKKKKGGFFGKIMELLTKEADDLDSEPEAEAKQDSKAETDENMKLLAELNKDNRKKEPKKNKKDKKKSAKKEKKKEPKAAAKEKKKPVKKKKEKEKKPAPAAEKPVKILNAKGLAAIVALCATLIASILILSMFLPQFAGRQEARTAFKDGDYKTVYTLFYKKNLSSKETEIYNKAKTVLRMERKMESYQNNIAMDRELEAVDALILGVKCYQGLKEADTYGVRQEAEAIYRQICGILESNYGISEEEAISITKYDDVAYTRRLRAIVGLDVPESEEESKEGSDGASEAAEEDTESQEEETEPEWKDILPEEEDLTGQ